MDDELQCVADDGPPWLASPASKRWRASSTRISSAAAAAAACAGGGGAGVDPEGVRAAVGEKYDGGRRRRAAVVFVPGRRRLARVGWLEEVKRNGTS